MKYMLLIHDTENGWGALSDEERQQIMADYRRFTEEIRASGHYRAGSQLQPTSTATTVRVRSGKRLVTDGPFAETREQLGGYYLVGRGSQRSHRTRRASAVGQDGHDRNPSAGRDDRAIGGVGQMSDRSGTDPDQTRGQTGVCPQTFPSFSCSSSSSSPARRLPESRGASFRRRGCRQRRPTSPCDFNRAAEVHLGADWQLVGVPLGGRHQIDAVALKGHAFCS